MDGVSRLMAVQNPSQYTHQYVPISIDHGLYLESPNLHKLPVNSLLMMSESELCLNPNLRFCHESESEHKDRLSMLFSLANEHLMFFVHCARGNNSSLNSPQKSQEVTP